MATLQTRVSPLQPDFLNSRRIEVSRDARFRYGYICRLIDDNELRGLSPALRSRTRDQHKELYWKSLSLLRRDAEKVLRVRRQKMAAKQPWDFQSLVGDYARVQVLLGKLTLAGLNHSVRLGAGLEGAREACRQFEALLTFPALPSPHAA